MDKLIYIRKSKRAKRIIFRVEPLKGIEVVVPNNISKFQANKVILRQSKSKWFKDAFKQIEKYREQLNPTEVTIGYPYETWLISYQEHLVGQKPYIIETAANCLKVTRDLSDSMLHINLLRQWHQGKAEKILVPLVKDLSFTNNIGFNKLKIKLQKNSWGSCSAKKNINLNRNLIFLSKNLIEYVILHELCHTKILSHSSGFWEILEQYLPKWKGDKTDLCLIDRERVPAWAMAE